MSTNERDLMVGGQAVIEGVMMRTPNAYAIAVRKADGTIVNTASALPRWSDKYPILKLPVLRGSAVLIQSMGLGIKALNYSASEAFAEAEEAKAAEIEVALTPAMIEGEGDFAGLTGAVPGLFPIPTRRCPKDELKKGGTAAAASSIVFALIFNVLLFVAAPLLLTNALFVAAGWTPQAAVSTGSGSDRVSNAGNDTKAQQAGAPAYPEQPWDTRTWGSVCGYFHPLVPSVRFNLLHRIIPLT